VVNLVLASYTLLVDASTIFKLLIRSTRAAMTLTFISVNTNNDPTSFVLCNDPTSFVLCHLAFDSQLV